MSGLHVEDLEEVGDDVDAGGGDGHAVADGDAQVAGAGEGEVAGDVLVDAAAHAGTPRTASVE